MSLGSVNVRERLCERLSNFHTTEYAWSNLVGSKLDSLAKAAVLVPIVVDGSEIKVWLTERSENVRHDKGHVSFPGGMKDDVDSDAIDTCLREAEEEIGLRREQVSITCQLLPRINIREILISPIVGIVDVNFRPMPNAEVSRAFCLPLERFLTNVNHYTIQFQSAPEIAHFFNDDIDGGTVVTWGLTASACIELACAVFDRPTEFPYYDNVPLSPVDPFRFRRRTLRWKLRQLGDNALKSGVTSKL